MGIRLFYTYFPINRQFREESFKLMVLFNILIVVIIPEKTVQCKTFTDTPYKVFSKL